jgi:hydroxymethylpyrimidine pyrophosphatase-like HAD family hydrolase/2-oxo-4-hydroxy-4-carboxy--5-ureidoimidazoline (OHCU) decarboxylase
MAVSKFLKTLGVTVSLPHKKQENRPHSEYGHPLKISSEFGILEHYQIYGVNPKSDNRQITSVVLSRKIGSQTQYLLLVRGEQNGLKGLMELSDTEQTVFRNLMVYYREQNLVRIIYAFKRLTKEEVSAYVNQYSGIVRSKRYDAESIMRVASPLETKLKFLGCLGVKAKIRDEAKIVVNKFTDGGLKVSIMSGDSYENTISIARELNLPPTNPTDSSSYFNLSFDSVARAKADFHLYTEQIYHTLKTFNYKSLNKSLETTTTHKLKESVLYMIGNKQSDHLLKSMVIGGKQLDIMLSSKYLIERFRVLLVFTTSIIGHDLQPFHKAKLTNMLRHKGDIILAVGDGLNDIGMFNEANLSIQLSNGDVPLYFGDIVVNRLDIIAKLVFFTGFNLNKNMKTSLIFHTMIWLKFTAMNLWLYNLVGCSFGFFYQYQVLIMMLFFFFDTFYKTCFLHSYPAELMANNPIIYQENKVFLNRILLIVYVVLLSIGLEMVLILVTAKQMVAQENTDTGYKINQEALYLYILTQLWINSAIKNYFLSNAPQLYRLTIFIACLTVYLMVIIYHGYYELAIESRQFNVLSLFTNKTIVTVFVVCWLVPAYLNWILVNVIYAKVIDPIKYYLVYNKDRHRVPWVAYASEKKEQLSKYISIESTKTTLDMIVDQIAEVIRPSKAKYIEPIMQKLLLLNIHEFSVGFDQFFNKILDKREHEKFCSVNAEKHYKFSLWFGLAIATMYAIELGIRLVYLRLDDWNDKESLYRRNAIYKIFLYLLMIILLKIKKRGSTAYRIVNTILFLVAIVDLSLFILSEVMFTDKYKPSIYHELSISSRAVSSALPLNFPQAVFLLISFEGLRIYKSLFSNGPVGNLFNNPLFISIIMMDLIALGLAKISMKKKVSCI